MLLGRSTPQWLGLITALSGLLQVLVVVLKPDVDPAQVAVVLGAITTFLGVFIAFLANTATTPVKDPQLVEGTSVRVTNQSGTVIGHANVPTPPLIPETPIEGQPG